MSWKTNEQQHNRAKSGKYKKGPQCYCCNRPAGHDYASHPLSDTTDASGVSWADTALVLCTKCSVATIDMTLVSQFTAYSATVWKEVRS